MMDNFSANGKELKVPGSGAFEITVRADLTNPKNCKICDETIFWAKTRKGKLMPISWSGGKYICHYNECKNEKY